MKTFESKFDQYEKEIIEPIQISSIQRIEHAIESIKEKNIEFYKRLFQQKLDSIHKLISIIEEKIKFYQTKKNKYLQLMKEYKQSVNHHTVIQH